MSAAHADLFDAPLLPGLNYREGIIDAQEERGLIAHIDHAELNPFKFQQWSGKRLTHILRGADIETNTPKPRLAT